jgi:hypothetical protein
VRENSEDPAVTVLVRGEVELVEKVADVGFDGALAEEEAFGDAGVRAAFGHELEDRAFPLVLTGTALLFAAELASIPLRHQRLDDTGPAIAGGVFGLAIFLGAVGLLGIALYPRPAATPSGRRQPETRATVVS